MPLAPVVKWVGGKTKLLPELRARAPQKFRRYYEPFLGGAAMFLDLAPEQATLGDMNDHLIEMYLALACHVDKVITALTSFRAQYEVDRNFYYQLREWWNESEFEDSIAHRAAAFITLNKTCFNGLWRVNKRGDFNVPAGDYANPTIFDPDHLRAAGQAFKKAELKVGDYKATTAEAGEGDFVYFDPPYDPINKTSNFTSYTKEGFGDAQQEALAGWALELRRRGATVMLSNNDTPMIRGLYRGFIVETVKCARPINSKGDKRGKVDEVIITGGPL